MYTCVRRCTYTTLIKRSDWQLTITQIFVRFGLRLCVYGHKQLQNPCTCTYARTYVYIHTCTYALICTLMYTCMIVMHMHIYTSTCFTHICMYVSLCMHAHTHAYAYVCIYASVGMPMCIYKVYVLICTCIHICVVCICMFTSMCAHVRACTHVYAGVHLTSHLGKVFSSWLVYKFLCDLGENCDS